MSHANPQIFTKDEATAAQRTFLFHLTNTADGSDATGKTIAGADFRLSKAGAALANATGAVTELAGGWYVAVLSAADVDTIGALGVDISESGCDDVHVTHQVTNLDQNSVTVALATGGITADTIATDAIGAAEISGAAVSKIQSGLATAAGLAAIGVGKRTAFYAMGTRTTDGNFAACSMADAEKTVITVTGTWNGATVTGQVCEDPKAAVPVWTPIGTPLTADGTIEIAGPHNAFRAVLSDDGASTSLTATAAIVKPGRA
jgi:hypothetical protein